MLKNMNQWNADNNNSMIKTPMPIKTSNQGPSKSALNLRLMHRMPPHLVVSNNFSPLRQSIEKIR